MGLRGNVGALRSLGNTIRTLPVTMAHSIAQRAAPALTDATRSAYDGNRSVYGDARPASKVTGRALTLNKTGETKAGLRYVANGRIVRCVLSTPWAKYLVGKYGVLPGSPTLPDSYAKPLAQIVADTKLPGAQ